MFLVNLKFNLRRCLSKFSMVFSKNLITLTLQGGMPESDGKPMAESDKFLFCLCSRERQVFLDRVLIDLGTIIVPSTVRQLKFLKAHYLQGCDNLYGRCRSPASTPVGLNVKSATNSLLINFSKI